MHQQPRFKIGQQYTPLGKHLPLIYTIVDIHTTYNVNGEHVRTRYVASHEFCGQIVKEYDIPEATIARGLSSEALATIDATR